MSGRKLGHTGGTIDKLECFKGLRTEMSVQEAERVVDKVGAAVVAQSRELVPADKALYKLRDETGTVAKLLFELCAEIKEKCGVRIEFVDLGGGLGIPYKPEQKAVDYDEVAKGIRAEYDRVVVPNDLDPLEIYWECGRPITGPYGWLITTAIHEKHIYREYIAVDACMADLMRPGMYGAYHEVTVSGKENAPKSKVYDVVGSLCENCDKFAVQRALPEIKIGDHVIIHDAGAHGRAMGFNYNGKLRCGEILMRPDGTFKEIRRKETIKDLFATLDLEGVEKF